MNNLDKQYLDIAQDILDNGIEEPNRTGINTLGVLVRTIQHDMADGFPLLTTRKVPIKSVMVELEGFLNGITDKRWYQERGCNFWSEWSNPTVVQEEMNESPIPVSPEEKKAIQKETFDLGPIYGYQWRNFGRKYKPHPQLPKGVEITSVGVGNKRSGDNASPLYSTWYMMLDRCYNENSKDYHKYGGRSVHVSNSWLMFENFERDAKLLKGWDLKSANWDEYTLDKDKLSGFRYSKETCMWLDKKEQCLYGRSVTGVIATSPDGNVFEYDTAVECADMHGLDDGSIARCLSGRYKHTKGWTFKRKNPRLAAQEGFDQLEYIVNELKTNPTNRRLVCSAWNMNQVDEMALPPCHVLFGVNFKGGRLHLNWYQRSCDWALGVPANIASYGMLLLLLATECGMKPGTLSGIFIDAHLYVNQLDGIKEQLSRKPADKLPQMAVSNADWADKFDIFKWTHADYKLSKYSCNKTPIDFGDIAV